MNFFSKKCCQSCGIPFDKDPMQGGTNLDGSKSTLYCSYCYKEGAFVQVQWTADDMYQYAKSVLIKKGVPEAMASMLCKGIYQLERWKNTEPKA